MRASLVGLSVALGLVGCGGITSVPTEETGGAGQSAGGTPGFGGSSTTGGAGGAGSTGGTTSSGGSGSTGGTCSGCVPFPTAPDIYFSATNPLPSGEQLLFSDWYGIPNRVLSIRPDGTNELEIFRAFRVASFGVSHSGNTIAFSSTDPLQLEHYGVGMTDAIQNTWLYDAITENATVLDYGNISDACHAFSNDDQHLYVCRSYDHTPDAEFHRSRIGRMSVATGDFEWLSPDLPDESQLEGQPSSDESWVYYTEEVGPISSASRNIVKKTLPNGKPEPVKPDASQTTLSPDGTKIAFTEQAAPYHTFVMNADGTNIVKVAARPARSLSWSPDGTRIAYIWSEVDICGHIDIVKADGSEVDSPNRIRNCVPNTWIFDIAWINRP